MQELRKLQEEAQQWQQENLKISEEIQSRKEEADRQSAICKELHESQEEAERQKVAWQEDARKAREDADRISLRNAEDFRRAQLEAEQQLALATRQAEELDECRVQTNQLLSAEAILLTEKSQILQELEEQRSEADRLCVAESMHLAEKSRMAQEAAEPSPSVDSAASVQMEAYPRKERKEPVFTEAELAASMLPWFLELLDEAEACAPAWEKQGDEADEQPEVIEWVIGRVQEEPHKYCLHFMPSRFRHGDRSMSPVRGRSLSQEMDRGVRAASSRAASLRRVERRWPR